MRHCGWGIFNMNGRRKEESSRASADRRHRPNRIRGLWSLVAFATATPPGVESRKAGVSQRAGSLAPPEANSPRASTKSQPVDTVYQSLAAPSGRDAVFRRLLATADLLAAVIGIGAIALVTSRDAALSSLVAVPLIVPAAKIMGRYDHDEVVLRKSTLDELP